MCSCVSGLWSTIIHTDIVENTDFLLVLKDNEDKDELHSPTKPPPPVAECRRFCSTTEWKQFLEVTLRKFNTPRDQFNISSGHYIVCVCGGGGACFAKNFSAKNLHCWNFVHNFAVNFLRWNTQYLHIYLRNRWMNKRMDLWTITCKHLRPAFLS